MFNYISVLLISAIYTAPRFVGHRFSYDDAVFMHQISANLAILLLFLLIYKDTTPKMSFKIIPIVIVLVVSGVVLLNFLVTGDAEIENMFNLVAGKGNG